MSTYNKGDLVLTTDGTNISTCIVLTEPLTVSPEKNYHFYYTYCIETDLYGIVYAQEITALVSRGFAPDFDFHTEIFDTDYEIYAELYESFSYFPMFHSELFDEDSDQDE